MWTLTKQYSMHAIRRKTNKRYDIFLYVLEPKSSELNTKQPLVYYTLYNTVYQIATVKVISTRVLRKKICEFN